MAEHIFPTDSLIGLNDRELLMKQKSVVIWLTGLSGSGKSTLGRALEKKLLDEGYIAFLLDGDSLRNGLNKDLGFSIEDRNENIRRAGEVCKLLSNAGLIVITSFISPLRQQRDAIRAQFKKGCFVEVFVNASLVVCESRDVKGLYKKARASEIKNFTGIDSPYEQPLSPELIIESDKFSEAQSLEKLYSFIQHLVKV